MNEMAKVLGMVLCLVLMVGFGLCGLFVLPRLWGDSFGNLPNVSNLITITLWGLFFLAISAALLFFIHKGLKELQTVGIALCLILMAGFGLCGLFFVIAGAVFFGLSILAISATFGFSLRNLLKERNRNS